MKSKNTNNKDGRRGPVRNTIDFMKGHYKKGPWNSIVIAVAAVLVFITTYKLILPALSMSRPTYCGMEEHVHTEECYSPVETRVEFDCPFKPLTQFVMEDGTVTTQGFDGVVIHTHDENCYQDGVLICPLPEVQTHVHTDECYQDVVVGTRTVEIPPQEGAAAEFAPEGEGMIEAGQDPAAVAPEFITEDIVERQLVCGRDEYNPELHVHTPECYLPDGTLICTLPQVVVHQHDAGCWHEVQTGGEVVCGLPEHMHVDACFEAPEGIGSPIENSAEGQTPQEAPAEGPAEAVVMEGTPAEAPAEAVVVEGAPAQAPAEAAVAEGTPSEAPAEAVIAEGTPSEAPAEAVIVEGTPSVSPAEAVIAEGTPAEGASDVFLAEGEAPQSGNAAVNPVISENSQTDVAVLPAEGTAAQPEGAAAQDGESAIAAGSGNEAENTLISESTENNTETNPDGEKEAAPGAVVFEENTAGGENGSEENGSDGASENVRPETADPDGNAATAADTAADSVSGEEKEEAADQVGSVRTARILEFRGSDYTVRIIAGEESGITAGATVTAAEIPHDSEEYAVYLAQAKAALGLEEDKELPAKYARFFDITIRDAEGNEIQPDESIRVDIIYDEKVESENVNAVHFEKDGNVDVLSGVEKTSPDTLEDLAADEQTMYIMENGAYAQDTAATAEGVSFDAKAFSVYGVVYAVDYQIVDGGEAPVNGGSQAWLTEILSSLGMSAETLIDSSLPDDGIKAVTSSDESLVKVAHLTGGDVPGGDDWKIETVIPEDGFEGVKSAIVTVETLTKKTEIQITLTGQPEVQAESSTGVEAVITAADGSYLPDEAVGTAEVVEGTQAEQAVARVEDDIDFDAESAEKTAENITGQTDEYKESTAADSQYAVYDIDLKNVETGTYEGGFRVNMTLPESLEGKDFRLFHLHEGKAAEEITDVEFTTTPGIEEGSQTVTAVSFVTDSFSQFIVKYTVDFTTEDGGSYSVLGGRSVKISELLGGLYSDNSDKWIENVDNVQNGNIIIRNSVQSGEESGITECILLTETTTEDGSKDWIVETRVPEDGAEINAEAEISITYKDGSVVLVSVRLTGQAEAVGTSADGTEVNISAADGSYLPEEASASAVALNEEDGAGSIAAVEEYGVVYADDSATVDGVHTDGGEDSADDGSETTTKYAVFDISLDGVDAAEYEQGFNVNLILPENIVGKDFRLFHIHDGVTTPVDVALTGTDLGDNVKDVTGISFTTDGFSSFVLKYTVDFEYEGRTFKFKGEGSYKLEEILENLGIYDEIESAELSLIEGEYIDGALYLTIVDGDYYINSDVAFSDKYELNVIAGGKKYTLIVTDAQYITDLATLLTNVSVKINGNAVQDGDNITVNKGDSFAYHLEFTENDFYQFKDDGSGMTYQLPAGINLGEARTTYITVNMGIDGKVYRNPVVYDPTTNTITLSWNTNDPNFRKLTATDNTKVVIDLTGYFNDDATHVEFSTDLTVDVDLKEKKDANIQKAGQLYKVGQEGNPYNVPAIKYTVTIGSVGQTIVNVSDTVDGTAIQLDTTNWSAVSDKGTTITPVFTTKGFTLNNQSLQNGETVTITYWGKVDTSGIKDITAATYEETGNKVTLKGNDIPDKEVTHFEREIGTKNVYKTSTGVEGDARTSQTVSWKIMVNENPTSSIAGSKITDSISQSSQSIMSYDVTSKPYLTVRDANGNVVTGKSRQLEWNELGIDIFNPAKTWTYNVPSDDGIYSYEITYKTVVDTSNMTEPSSVTNNVETKNGSTTGTANVGPKPEGEKYQISKTKVDVSEEETVWSITVTADAGDYNSFIVTDLFPRYQYNTKYFVDGYKDGSVRILGLEGDEWVDVVKYQEFIDNANAQSVGDSEKYSKVEFVFYRDGKDSSDKSHPGLSASGQRTFTIELTSINSQSWIEEAKKGADEALLKHTNAANINGVEKSTYAEPMDKTVFKYRGNSSSERPIVGPEASTDANRSGGVSYPRFDFRVNVGGVKENTVVIEDYFDTDLFKVYVPDPVDHNWEPQFWGGNGDKKYAHNKELTDYANNFSFVEGDGKVTFTITNIPMDDKAYYSFYMVQYSLIPKSIEAWNEIKRLAMENGGEYIFSNIAKYGDSTDRLDFKYNYKVLNKSAVSETDQDTGLTLEKYTIRINPDKLNLIVPDSENDILTLTDTYSTNLSIDFGSIKITAIDKNDVDRSSEVTWDYRKNVGTFTIPDETAVTITYSARVVGDPGSVQTVTNTAYMEGYSDTVSSERVVDISGGATAERVRIRLFKFAADHMEGGLDGAVFRLLDQDQNPVKDNDGNDITFTTGIGYLNKYGVVNAATDHLDTTYVESSGLYTTGATRNDLTPEAQTKWDNGEIADPTNVESMYVTYGDLSEAGRNRLGVTLYHGFADITLNQELYGVALKKERAYYLEEIVTPVDSEGRHYEKDFIKYSFLITDQSDYSAPAGIYVYHNNDVLTVRNWPTENTSLKIAKVFTGNADLTAEQKNKVTFTIQRKNNNEVWENYPVSIWDESEGQKKDTATFTYGSYGVTSTGEAGSETYSKGDPLFQDGIFTITDIEAGTYRVIESNASMQDTTGKVYSHTTEYLVDGVKQTVIDDSNGVSVTVTEQDVIDKASHDITITNSYFTNKYQITKVSSDTAQVLGNAEFKIVKVNQDGTAADVKTGIRTDSSGKLSVQLNENTWDSSFNFEQDTLYYVVETAAPSGYVLPAKPDEYYFYFSSEPAGNSARWTPGTLLPTGETAIDLSVGYGSATIPNKPDVTKTFVKIDKQWVNSVGKDVTSSMTDAEAVNVTLYRTTDALTSGIIIDGNDEENPKNASAIKTLTVKWGNNQETKVNFISGDRIQVTMRTSDNSIKIKPSASGSDFYYNKKVLIGEEDYVEAPVKSWLLTTTGSGNNPTLTISEDKGSTYGLTVNNLETATRVYKLTQAEAEAITNPQTVEANIRLSASNNWTRTINNLDLTDSNGNPYFYFIVEDGTFANTTTSYDIGSKTITVTNTAPEQLEVNKRWEDANGDSINNQKTDGSITYELYQVENPLAVGSYTGDGAYSVDLSGVNTSYNWDEASLTNVSGHTKNIMSGSKVQIEITANNQSNQSLEGNLTIIGANLVSDKIEDHYETVVYNQYDIRNEWRSKTRTIIINNINGNIVLNGTIKTNTSLPVTVTVLEEPTNASTEWSELVKNKIGEVELTHQDAVLTKTEAFGTSSIRASKGTKAWSSLIFNLPSKGIPSAGNNAGSTVNYSYYVVEKNTPVASNFNDPTYQVGGREVTIANGQPGDTIVITNKEKDNPKGSVKVTKNFVDIESSQIPANFKITASWTEDTTPVSKELTVSGNLPENVSRTESGLSYEWTISEIPLDTIVTFTESGYDVDGYYVIVTGSANAATATAIAATTPGEASFVNTYTETTSISKTKAWAGGTWPADTTVTFTLRASIEGVNDYTIVDVNGSPVTVDQEISSGTTDHKAEWTNLPVKYAVGSTVKTIQYSVFETKVKIGKTEYTGAEITDRWTQSEENDVITNTPVTRDITAQKHWKAVDTDTSDLTLTNASATFALYISGETDTITDATVKEYDSNNANPVTVTGNGTATWAKLPKYDASGDEIPYVVRETASSYQDGENTISSSSTTGDTISSSVSGTMADGYSVTNAPKTEIIGGKTWSNTSTWPTDMQVKIKLQTSDGTDVGTEQILTSSSKTYTWSNLQKYASNGSKISYKVVETAVSFDNGTTWKNDPSTYFTVTDGTSANQYTVNNTPVTTSVQATKTWKLTDGTTTINLDDSKPVVRLTLYTDTACTTEVANLPNSQTATVEITGNAVATWTNLPKYDASGAEIQYTVKEVEVKMPGEETFTNVSSNNVYGGTVETDASYTTGKGFTVTNIPKTEFDFYKSWTTNAGNPEEWPIGVNSITVQLTRSSTESGAPNSQSVSFTVTKNSIKVVDGGDFTVSADQISSYQTGDTKPSDNLYHYLIKNLDRYWVNGQNSGKWTYKITETAVDGEGGYVDKYHDTTTSGIHGGVSETGRSGLIQNDKSTVSLPATGGTGTRPFTVAGCSLIAFSAMAFVYLKRRKYLVPVESTRVRGENWFEKPMDDHLKHHKWWKGGGSRR